MKEIAVVTTVYNRADKIDKLYKSLCAQTDKDFEWIIVDDGSIDSISDVIAAFDGTISVKFISQKNGGKCSACIDDACLLCDINCSEYQYKNIGKCLCENCSERSEGCLECSSQVCDK